MIALRLPTLLLGAWLTGCSASGILNQTISTSGLTITHDVAYGAGPRHTLDVYRPTNAAGPLPLVVFIYGGGWRSGSKSIYPFVAATLARRGAVVMVPDYRLYPDVAFPDFLQDNAEAIGWAHSHAAEYRADPARLFVIGHSAGAYNAAMLALNPAYLAAVGLKPTDLAGVIGLAGPYDFLPMTDPDVIPVFAPVQDGPASQPITYANGHNPPMLLAAGTADTVVNPQNTVSLSDRIAALGGPVERLSYPGLGHIGIIIAFAPLFEGRAPVLDDVWRFIVSPEPKTVAAKELAP